MLQRIKPLLPPAALAARQKRIGDCLIANAQMTVEGLRKLEWWDQGLEAVNTKPKTVNTVNSFADRIVDDVNKRREYRRKWMAAKRAKAKRDG